MNSFFPMIKNISLTGLQNQVVKDCDYFDEKDGREVDGVLE